MNSTQEPKGSEPLQRATIADQIGLAAAEPIAHDELAELDFLRLESQHLNARVRDLEIKLETAQVERDTIQHERNLMAQDFQWTLDRLASSPLKPVLDRLGGYRRLQARWGSKPA